MKNSLIFIFISIIVSFFIYYMNGCGDKATGPTYNYDPGILLTDEFGNVLGGDTTDWCMHSSDSVSFGAAYPNPASIIVHIRFHIPSEDTVKVYFLKSSIDTTTFFQGHVMPGTYTIDINDSMHVYKNTYQRVYFKSKHFSSSPYCRFYGDIKFAE